MYMRLIMSKIDGQAAVMPLH